MHGIWEAAQAELAELRSEALALIRLSSNGW
jgi:hypothetical protein